MQPLRVTVLFISTIIASISAAILAYFLHQNAVDERVILGVALAVFGVLDKLLTETWRASDLRARLRESLNSFFEKLERHDKSQPLWEDLQHQISALRDIESSPDLRKLLCDAMAEIMALRKHETFVALTKQENKTLLRLYKAIR